MVQVDVFWSYGLGASFAITAARQLRARQELRAGGGDAALAIKSGELASGMADALDKGEHVEPRGSDKPASGTWWPDFKDLLQNRFMVVNILYAALIFAPSGLYLLWDFTNWETMQAGTKSMPAWLIVGFAITNITQAMLGFWVTERLIVHGRQYLAAMQTFIGYFGMFFILVHGWDSFGWHRFFSEDRADFLAWNSEPAIDQVTSWLTSSVALTLFAMGFILIPIMATIMLRNYRGGLRLGGAYSINRKPLGVVPMTAAFAAFVFSGVPLAVVSHLIIDQLGWILGGVASAAFIYATCLNSRFGLFHVFYPRFVLDDDAYDRLVSKSSHTPATGGRVAPSSA
jgi:hypothetical protein